MTSEKFTPNDIDIRIGKMIQIMRARFGMSQKDLARMTGVTFQQIQKYECANNRISASRLYQIAHAMGIPVAAFYNESAHGVIYDKYTMDLIHMIYKLSDNDKKLLKTFVNRLTQ